MAKKVNPTPKLPPPPPAPKPPLGIASRPRARPVFSRKRWLLYFEFHFSLHPSPQNAIVLPPKDPTHPQTLLFLCYFFFLCVFCVIFFPSSRVLPNKCCFRPAEWRRWIRVGMLQRCVPHSHGCKIKNRGGKKLKTA